MMEVGVIGKPNSLWMSEVILVRKKGGSLEFCVDLQNLVRIVNDTYALPRIDEKLHCLSRAIIFTAFHHTFGYWLS